METKKQFINWMKEKLEECPNNELQETIVEYESMSNDKLKLFVETKLKPVIATIDPFIDMYMLEYGILDATYEDFETIKGFLKRLVEQY